MTLRSETSGRPGTPGRRRPGRAAPGGQAGFTLIELLVVLVILGLLAGLVAPRVIDYLGGARSSSAQLQLRNLSAALDLFRLDVNRYPTTAEGLEALVRPPPGVTNWRGPYLRQREIPRDPWGNPFRYRSPGEHGPFDLFSLGEDNAVGGDGENRDITSW